MFLLLSGENDQLRVGVRRASKQLPLVRSTYFSSANLHLGVLAAASHAAKENIRFSVIYNPRLVRCMSGGEMFLSFVQRSEFVVRFQWS